MTSIVGIFPTWFNCTLKPVLLQHDWDIDMIFLLVKPTEYVNVYQADDSGRVEFIGQASWVWKKSEYASPYYEYEVEFKEAKSGKRISIMSEMKIQED